MSDARLRPDEAPSDTVESIVFGFYSAEEVRKMSVKALTKAELLDTKEAPVLDGLYDPALGPIKELDSCKSCGLQQLHCTGHFGHIDLARTIYNPLVFRNLISLLKISCFYCHKFKMGQNKVLKYVSILNLIIEGNILLAKRVAANFWNDAVFRDEDAGQHTDLHVEASNINGRWTSIQQTEATSVLFEIMQENRRKCYNCDKVNPVLHGSNFGWLEMSIKKADVKANLIEDFNLNSSSKRQKKTNNNKTEKAVDNEEVLHPESHGSALQSNNELVNPENTTKGTNRSTALSHEFINHITTSGLVDLTPSEVESILKDLWMKESKLCMLICDIQCRNLSIFERERRHEMFFLKVILVPPNKFRPPATFGNGLLEHPQNVLLSKVIESNIALHKAIISHQDILQNWRGLQNSVSLLFDSTKGYGKRDKAICGIRQMLDKKEGMLRQKLMGKRVNFACRSVISPDPYLAVNEIGIPLYFAMRLTYPERVTPWNANKLRQAVKNGPENYPGATHYMEKEKFYTLQAGMDIRNAISRKLPTSRAYTKVGIAPETKFEGKFVYRHLQDGDIVLVNRQPTLHKPGMMAHVVRVMKGEKTIRMHYANCSTYNADFDGDEMNVHVPQDEISRAESLHIVNANEQYIVPTSGDPIRSLMQDHIVSAVLLTKMDTFLTREEYNQLLYASCVPPREYASQAVIFGQKISSLIAVDDIQPLPPAIWKPKPLWTGKQVITAILHHITKGHLPLTVEKDGRIPKEYFGNDATEKKLFVYNNDLVHGVMDKAQFGRYGLVHTVHELYGADTAGQLLAVFSRLFTLFLQMYGFTCGVDDLLVFQKSDKKRQKILETSERLSEDVHIRFTAAKTNDLKDSLQLLKETEKTLRRNGEAATTRLDRMMSNALNALTSDVNKALFPNGLRKRFPNNCLSLMTSTGAKGGLVNMTQISSLLGQQELEGKRVPRMISGKTLPCFPAWDISSRAGGFVSDRFLTGLRPQEYYFHCMAGREGLVDTAVKTSRSGYLQRCLVKSLECLQVCYDHTVRDADGSIIQFTYGEDGIDVQKSSFLGEFDFLMMNQKVVREKMSGQLKYTNLSKSNGYMKELPVELKDKAMHFCSQIVKNPNGYRNQIRRNDLMKLLKFKYLSSLAEPGEAVGVLAAQSVGEPSTQMTLNTFHLAGRGEMNVTLGIPRLIEILMHAKVNIRTPVITCPLLDWRTREDAEFIAAKLRRVSLADVIESIKVSTVPFSISGKQVSTTCKLTIKLYSPDLYPPHSGITLAACMETLQTAFVKEIEDDLAKHLTLLSRINGIKAASFEKVDEPEKEDLTDFESQLITNGGEEDDDNAQRNDNDDDEDVLNAEDLGADAEKSLRQANDEVEYDDNTENEDENDEMLSESEVESDIVGDDKDEEKICQDPNASHAEAESALLLPVAKKKVKPQVKKKAILIKHAKRKEWIFLAESKGLEFEAHFKFDLNEPHVLLAQIAQKTAKRIYVKEVKNIERCSVVEPKRNGDPLLLQTAGVNFNVFWALHDYLDVNKIVTNNIHAMLTTYGVEAARETILNEVKGVFDAYGIRVNIRHLMLIADLMTSSGEYRPLNRMGMRKFSTSPLCKMSFEVATNVITESAFHGHVDTMDSPSACISLGKIVKLGTGSFDLFQNVKL